MLGRPVRWRSTRQEGFLSDNQARDTIIEGRRAMDADCKFLALDIDSIAALGAYHTSHGAFIATVNFACCLPLAPVLTSPSQSRSARRPTRRSLQLVRQALCYGSRMREDVAEDYRVLSG